MKECNLDCALQHEGCCTREDIDCNAKSDNDLITEEEYDKLVSTKNTSK